MTRVTVYGPEYFGASFAANPLTADDKGFSCVITRSPSWHRHRLQKELEAGGGLSDGQFGFRKGRSTIHAIKMVQEEVRNNREGWTVIATLDVRNAFNTAKWNLIIRKIRERGVSAYLINLITNYLKNRSLIIEKNEEMEVTRGVPQGSVLGPTLWNILYNDVLNIELTQGAKAIAYADDLALLVNARDLDDLNHRLNESARRIDWWLTNHGLDIAPEKTELVVLRGPRKRNGIYLHLRGQEIYASKTTKYL